MRGLVAVLAATVVVAPAWAGDDGPALPEQAVPLAELPARPRPIVEIGAPFLGTGPLGQGVTLPTGATWQPSLLAWGLLRSAVHGVREGGGAPSGAEWANRLDLFTQLSLSPTERVVFGVRPLDEGGRFTGHVFSPESRSGGVDATNLRVESLYFEGDFGELFPKLDPRDRRALDFGFAVGRMPIVFQDGMLVGDALDAVGLVRNSLHPLGASNLRVTAIAAWGDVDRAGRVDEGAELYGLFAEADLKGGLWAADMVWVDAPAGDGLYAGISLTRRFAQRLDGVLRILGSAPLGADNALVGRGVLLFVALSTEPARTHDLVYLDLFAGLDEYTPAARAAGAGGVLARAGILFEGAGLGGYAPVLDSDGTRAVGGALGYQRFLGGPRMQVVVEVGARAGTEGGEAAAWALGTRLQRALGRRLVVRLDAFGVARGGAAPRYGGRGEVLLKF